MLTECMMSNLSGFFIEASPGSPREQKHSVIVHFQYGRSDWQPIYDLEDQLRGAIDNAGVGEYDGHEVAVDDSDGYLFMYGPDADRLFDAVRPLLEACDFMQGATVRLQYGPPEDWVRETDRMIGS